MARANQGNSLSFGFAALGVKRNGVAIGFAEITGNFTASVAAELVTTSGGASVLPVESRKARASGEGSITLKERPDWLDSAFNEGITQETAAAGAPVASALTNLTGNSVGTGVVAAATDVKHYLDVEVEATAAKVVTVKIAGSIGASVFEGVVLTENNVSIGQTGLQLKLQASGTTLTSGDKAAFSVSPAHGGITTISIPSVQLGHDYEITCYTAKGGSGDAVNIYTFPRVVVSGVNVMGTDVETIGEVEIPIQVLTPADGSAIYQRRIVKPV